MRQNEVRSARGGGRRGREVMKLKAQGRINVIMKVFHFVSALCIRKVSCGHVRYYSVEGVSMAQSVTGGEIRVYGGNKGAREFSCGQRDLCRLSEAQPQAGNSME